MYDMYTSSQFFILYAALPQILKFTADRFILLSVFQGVLYSVRVRVFQLGAGRKPTTKS